MDERFFATIMQCFFIALGVVLGGAFIGSIGAFASGEPPFSLMNRIARSLRIWAIVASIGGTFDVISNFERGIIEGETIDIVKQILIIITAMAGVQVALMMIEWLSPEEIA
ncbi:Sporulation protein YtrH [Pelagirhabdus alkalitolerans]|uniref:Sporulation protein YtrH n=1 Tax=Pelagirhabdus alkalitolerans TaxID=1612202 RepID=A0A1G6HJG9_9BACI|nr:YtrH family sporulation protein [Pelagirhabdus alkalitolerans]SDB94477.1 Sporulation protein YtrH [Pelagirhabdus alkalitolerans]